MNSMYIITPDTFNVKSLWFPFNQNFEISYYQTLLSPNRLLLHFFSVVVFNPSSVWDNMILHRSPLARIRMKFSESSLCRFFQIITCYWNTATAAGFLHVKLWLLRPWYNFIYWIEEIRILCYIIQEQQNRCQMLWLLHVKIKDDVIREKIAEIYD